MPGADGAKVKVTTTQGLRAVITGASSGIGLALTYRLRMQGGSVLGIDREPAAFPEDHTYQHLCLDLANSAEIASFSNQFSSFEPTAFIHCAGIVRDDAFEMESGGIGGRLWQIHVASALQIVHAILPVLPNGEGRIVLISSRASQGRAGRGLYAASKAGCEALARSLALEVLPRAITVNAVSPGPTDTPQLHDPARATAAVARPPIGRFNTADEVAQTISFLLSPAAGTITGQVLFQCGGLSLPGPTPSPIQQRLPDAEIATSNR